MSSHQDVQMEFPVHTVTCILCMFEYTLFCRVL